MKRVALVVLLIAAVLPSYAQEATQACSSARQAQDALVGAFRVMNTAELRYYAATQRYATVPELLNFDETKKLSANKSYSLPSEGSVAIGTADDPLPGYVLRVVLGTDGKSYVITATKKSGTCEYVGATTDERGLIFLIEPLR